ncbi:hypothetical protein [Gordonia sp. (in: high G+C Gram-positive bacteria)]|uniref:hypothetical protein n=1 Tax=Gordonia sp. (in: high G+C Gram-positive bacteria) TaxID=84139 RepID=UPI0033415A42
MSAQDVIAAVIHAHQYKGTIAVNRPSLVVQCSCGHEEPCAPRQGRIVHSAHVAAALIAATAHAEAGEES